MVGTRLYPATPHQRDLRARRPRQISATVHVDDGGRSGGWHDNAANNSASAIAAGNTEDAEVKVDEHGCASFTGAAANGVHVGGVEFKREVLKWVLL